MIELLGWLGTSLILLGYFLNAKARYYAAMMVWIIGDIVWISYDVVREIYPHLALSSIVIFINVYGIYNILKNKSRSRAAAARQAHNL